MMKQNIQNDMKVAMKAQDAKRLLVIRTLLAAIKQKEIDEQVELSDAQVLAVVDKMVKQRQDSIKQFELAKRQDLINVEAFEISILQAYLPPPFSQEEIQALVETAMKTVNATGVQDIGKVMDLLKPQLQGRADMSVVSKLVKEKLF
ncbi:MAG: hypothetical protein K0Q74_902 [Gammaproteobacteria bacterium]|jgi:uncharacterized protein YqeY|nr:hypothetical protein [Gammaproteobacteria bacterium]